ncbi:MAG: MraY family glycosyltransferase [Coriobacteriia bacterium]|nr:MraY family glycosyltransferase [Coriobacteriia bacterium]
MEVFWQAGIVFFTALLVTLIMVPVSKKIARKIGAIDYPSNRRVNTVAVPRCGGIALYVGFLAGLGAFWIGIHVFHWRIVDFYTLERINYPLLLAAVTLIFAVGLFDDVKQISARVKFAWQTVGALVVALSGVSLDVIATSSGDVSLGWLDIPLTVFYLLVFMNIINLIDGLDGLAAGITTISSLTFMYLVFQRGSMTLTMVCLALVAVCLAFLVFNFHPASVFMGDSGALFLGLMLGIVSLLGVVRTQSLAVLMVPLTVAAVPVIDTASAIVRRKVTHKAIGEPDMNHIHHRLLRFGLGQTATVLVLYLCTAVSSVIAIAVTMAPDAVRTGVVVLLVVVGIVIICLLGVAGPVLQHHYEGKGKKGSRAPQDPSQSGFIKKIK